MSHQNFHNYFYDMDHRSLYANVNHHFEHYKGYDYFYSYSTVIAVKFLNQNSERVMIRTLHRYNTTTLKHSYDLRSATPHNLIDKDIQLHILEISYVGFARNLIHSAADHCQYIIDNSEFLVRKSKDRAYILSVAHDIKSLIENKHYLVNDNPDDRLGFKENFIKEFKRLYESIKTIVEKCESMEDKLAKRRKQVITEEERIKRDKKNARAKERLLERTEEIKKDPMQANEFLDKNAKYRRDKSTQARIMKAIRYNDESSTSKHVSYVFVHSINDKPEVHTSQNVKLSVEVVRLAFSLYAKGLLAEGDKIGPYSIVKICDSYMQIGCHCIPMWNIHMLESIINNIKTN